MQVRFLPGAAIDSGADLLVIGRQLTESEDPLSELHILGARLAIAQGARTARKITRGSHRE